MEPLRVTARVQRELVIPRYGLALDSLLAAAVALREQLPPAREIEEVIPIEIPIELEPERRFHLASNSVCRVAGRSKRHTNKRPVIAEAQQMGGKIKRMQINAGPSKGYRIPYETVWPEDGTLTWWAVGDPAEVEGLLGLIGYLGKRRGVGLGRVLEWEVEPCEPWGDGFPVVLDGQPLRALPPDWPGLEDPAIIEARLSYMGGPYWMTELREPCAVPLV
jgi:CRISPR type IV-associated protein Csf3